MISPLRVALLSANQLTSMIYTLVMTAVLQWFRSRSIIKLELRRLATPILKTKALPEPNLLERRKPWAFHQSQRLKMKYPVWYRKDRRWARQANCQWIQIQLRVVVPSQRKAKTEHQQWQTLSWNNSWNWQKEQRKEGIRRTSTTSSKLSKSSAKVPTFKLRATLRSWVKLIRHSLWQVLQQWVHLRLQRTWSQESSWISRTNSITLRSQLGRRNHHKEGISHRSRACKPMPSNSTSTNSSRTSNWQFHQESVCRRLSRFKTNWRKTGSIWHS